MKPYLYVILAFFCCSCVENTIDSQQDANTHDGARTLRTLLTKSSATHQEDSLKIMSKLQSDVDNLMMGRVFKKDSLYVLAIKKDDALSLGVSEDVYDKYLDYVDRLNEYLLKDRR